jgi:hypothetical protein
MQTFKTKILMALTVLVLGAILLLPLSVLAAGDDPCHPENRDPPQPALTQDQLKSCESCHTSGSPSGNPATPADIQNCLSNNTITKRLNQIVNFLSAGVGIVVAGVITLGGIQYTLAGGNATAITAARQRIMNGLLALVLFMFIYAILQWIIPGGVFG